MKSGMVKVFVVLFLILSFDACAGRQKSVDERYREALADTTPESGLGKLFRDCQTAVGGLRRFIDANPFDSRAPDAQIRIARCFEEESNWADAEQAWRTFIALYPGHAKLSVALYGAGEAQFQQRETVDRDQGKVRQALTTFARVIRDYPTSIQADSAGQRYQQIRDLLAEHDWRIGRWYEKQGKPLAAYTRWLSVAEKYAETHYGKKAGADAKRVAPQAQTAGARDD